MTQNICEYLREKSVEELFKTNTFSQSWTVWKGILEEKVPYLTGSNIIDLGDILSDTFRLTSSEGRSQSSVSGAGNAWESLVCWYLNLCLIGTRTVVIKQKKALVPQPIRTAITVNYGTFPSNTESDLIAITFPEKSEYTNMDKFQVSIRNNQGLEISTTKRNRTFNYSEIINTLVERDFTECEVGIIQCKTNWNDNAQIPMLWDMIYSSKGFNNSISVGDSSFAIKNLKKFTYSFVTVPTVDLKKIKSDSTCVKRVQNISGGNYWGHSSLTSVASSIKGIFGRNFSAACDGSLLTNLNKELPHLQTKYQYFKLF